MLVARVTNRTGHRLPTGYADGRRVWLAVDVIDAAGTVTPISGNYDDATAELETSDPQLHVYEAVQGRFGQNAVGHLAQYDIVQRDTRIPPSGFHPPPGLEPVGADYSGGAGGSLRNWDDARYAIDLGSNVRGPITVRVRARYQATTREYVTFLASENHTDMRGQDLQHVYEGAGRDAPFDMAEASAQVAITPPVADAGADGATDGAVHDDGAPRGSGCACRTSERSDGQRGWMALASLALTLAAVMRRRAQRRS
jgi:MYXO-CTERM domain-containing protein